MTQRIITAEVIPTYFSHGMLGRKSETIPLMVFGMTSINDLDLLTWLSKKLTWNEKLVKRGYDVYVSALKTWIDEERFNDWM